MKKQNLQKLQDELFTLEEVKSTELQELVDVLGGQAPSTGKSSDCSSPANDQTGTNDSTKYHSDSQDTDTVRAEDGCNDAATVQILDAINQYNQINPNATSGDLMGDDAPQP